MLSRDLRFEDFEVATLDGMRIFVRKLSPRRVLNPAPFILIHGARVAGLASFDLPVEGGSLAADLADALGRSIYVFDARGYGASQRPAAFDLPPEASRPQCRAYEVIRDIDAVANSAMRECRSDCVGLLGWATGGMWALYYASLHPEAVRYLVVLNTLYGGSKSHAVLGSGTAFQHPDHADRFNDVNFGAYRYNAAASLSANWDSSIPIAEKSLWRDPAVLDAYLGLAIASDPTSATRQPATFRSPTGALADSFYQAIGRQLFDANQITSHVLVVRCGLDFWSRPEDAHTLLGHLCQARSLQSLILPNATHYVHLDRAECGRDELLRSVRELSC